MVAARQEQSEQLIDRYAIYDKIAAGGMAVVHLGRLLGQAGFSRTVAVKRLHPQFATDPEFVAMFLDEAHLAVRVQHPNVVAPLDVVVTGDELLVVMEYVSGETLAQLMRGSASGAPPGTVAVLSSILVGTLYGLHAAHEALGENGQPLNIVHRDVSPQNVIVGVDGVPRVLDFGVAKAAMRSHATKEGEIKGKIAYMSPDQLRGLPIDRRADVFAAGVVFWEALTGRRLFRGDDLGQTVERVLHAEIPPPSSFNPDVSPELDRVLARALERNQDRRFATAREFAVAIERATRLASVSEVSDWVKEVGGAKLAERVERVAAIENHSSNRLRIAARSPMLTPIGIEGEIPPESISARLIVRAGEADAREPSMSLVGRATMELPVVEPARGEPPSVSRSLSAPRASRFRKLAPLAVCVVGLVALTFALTRATGSATQANTVTPVAPMGLGNGKKVAAFDALLPAAPAAPTTDAVQPAPSPVAPREPDAAPVATPSGSKSAITRHTSALTTRPNAAPAANKRADCSPPFTLDAKGIRRIKPGCI